MKKIRRFSALLLSALMLLSLLPVTALAKADFGLRGEAFVAWNFDSDTNVATTARP